jgi:flagellar basal-body rod modification protein FlgD
VDVLGVSGSGSTQQFAQDQTKVLDKDEFMQLLTVQLQHQDPLDPMNNEEMIAQLAQFSSLEQLENMNANLESSINLDLMLTQVLNNTAAAGLIGKTIVAAGNMVTLDDSDSVPINFDLASDAHRAVVTVYDENGTAVRTIEAENLESGRNMVSWDGTGTKGSRLAAGTYTFEVQAFDAEDNAIGVTHLVIGRIEKAKFADGEAIVILSGLEVPISEIVEIYMDEPTA